MLIIGGEKIDMKNKYSNLCCGVQNESFHQHPATPLDYRQETYFHDDITYNTQRMITISACPSVQVPCLSLGILVCWSTQMRTLIAQKPTAFWQHPNSSQKPSLRLKKKLSRGLIKMMQARNKANVLNFFKI